MIQKDSPTFCGRSPYTLARDAGFRHNFPQPECMVQCSGVGSIVGQGSTLLHGFLLSQCPQKKDSYPLLRIHEVLKSLVSAGHFSCLNLKSGFWQIKMDESSKQYTAFTFGNLGFFECDCRPFDLCNVPATFQRLMQN